MQDRFKFRVYFKGSDYADAGYVDLTRSDVIFMLRADGQIIRNVVYECQQEGHEGSPCNMPFTPNNDLYDIQFCTGLKDKNGKLIYEGDIVKIGNGSVNGSVIETIRKIEWGINCFNVPSWITDKPDFSHYVIVIGNIYENPELLED